MAAITQVRILVSAIFSFFLRVYIIVFYPLQASEDCSEELLQELHCNESKQDYSVRIIILRRSLI